MLPIQSLSTRNLIEVMSSGLAIGLRLALRIALAKPVNDWRRMRSDFLRDESLGDKVLEPALLFYQGNDTEVCIDEMHIQIKSKQYQLSCSAAKHGEAVEVYIQENLVDHV